MKERTYQDGFADGKREAWPEEPPDAWIEAVAAEFREDDTIKGAESYYLRQAHLAYAALRKKVMEDRK